jgi:hypothetical protein
MSDNRVHQANEGGALMDVPTDLAFLRKWAVIDLDVLTDKGVEPGILRTEYVETDGNLVERQTLLTLEVAEAQALTLAAAVSEARKRMRG